MKYFLLALIFVLFSLTGSVMAASKWVYPLSDFDKRTSLKSFGEYFDKQSYIGRENIFPSQYTGYHAAIDLEIFPKEQNQLVPIYAISDGKIVYASTVTGYGGVILLQLTGTEDTALYGHVKLTDLPFKVGDSVNGGSKLSYLGDAFSGETGGERKHLHFGIYKGNDLYFRGYELTEAALKKRWIDPVKFLNEYISPIPPTAVPISEYKTSPSLFTQIITAITNFIRSLF